MDRAGRIRMGFLTAFSRVVLDMTVNFVISIVILMTMRIIMIVVVKLRNWIELKDEYDSNS